MKINKKVIIIAAVAVVCLAVGLFLGIKFGCNKKANTDNNEIATQYVSETNQFDMFIFKDDSVSHVIATEDGTISFKGTYKKEAYTTKAGNSFTYSIHWTEAQEGSTTMPCDETVYFRITNGNIEYLAKENETIDDIPVFVKDN